VEVEDQVSVLLEVDLMEAVTAPVETAMLAEGAHQGTAAVAVARAALIVLAVLAAADQAVAAQFS
jgi:hypothetical protein